MSRKHKTGRHLLQIPGPSNVPDRILRAMDFPTIDHRSEEFFDLAKKCLSGIKDVFKTKSHVIIYPASGTGAWEAALVNTLSPGDTVLMVETGHFASLWVKLAKRLGLNAELIETNWRRGADAEKISQRLSSDKSGKIRLSVLFIMRRQLAQCLMWLEFGKALTILGTMLCLWLTQYHL